MSEAGTLYALATGKENPGDIVQSVVIETALFPPITFDHPMQDTKGPPNPFLALLRPRITINNTLRGPIVSHPWGDPVNNYWPELAAVLVILGMASAWLIFKRA